MPQKPYMAKTDEEIAVMLGLCDDNLGGLAGKYAILSATLLRIKQGRLCWRWFLDDLENGRQWTESVTGNKNRMLGGPGGAAQVMPAGPIQPAIPQIDLGAGLQNIKWEPDFFVFFGGVIAGIKNHELYQKSDGDLIGVEGAEIAPPDMSIITPLKVTKGPGGQPQLEVPKSVFSGFDYVYKIGNGPVQQGTFVATRRWVHAVAMPPAGEALVYSFQARYRYKGVPFGQPSLWVTIPVGT